MPYKYTGDYYRRRAGDYYRSQAGGLFGLALPLLGKLGKAGLGLLTKRKGAAAAIAKFATRPTTTQARTAVGVAAGLAGAFGVGKARGKKAALMDEGMMAGVSGGRGFGGGGRRMNTLNPKALSRATRRIKGFKDRAQSALSQLGFKVVRTGGGGGRSTSRVCR